MRFQNIENSKIYRIYRQDQLDRLRKKIEQIKTRKNQHLGDSREKHKLPFISPGFGFSKERQRQIQLENSKLQERIKKVKENHSSYFLAKPKNKKSPSKKSNLRRIQSMTNRSFQNSLIIPESTRTERKEFLEKSPSQIISPFNTLDEPQQPQSFRKEIMKLYDESFQNPKKQTKKTTRIY